MELDIGPNGCDEAEKMFLTEAIAAGSGPDRIVADPGHGLRQLIPKILRQLIFNNISLPVFVFNFRMIT